jgi:hypothetical protein
MLTIRLFAVFANDPGGCGYNLSRYIIKPLPGSPGEAGLTIPSGLVAGQCTPWSQACLVRVSSKIAGSIYKSKMHL